MNIIITAIIATGTIGLISAVVITVASRIMFVKVDPRVAKLRSALPGANCGACGFSSCDLYAEMLAKGETETNLCPPGGDMAFKYINEILGITGETTEFVKKTAIVHCLGDNDTVRQKIEYIGMETCFAAHEIYGGESACTFGCIGYGDCVSVCPDNAICVEDGLVRFDPRKCSGCGVCLDVCPTGVISVQLAPVTVAVMCKNTERGGIVKDKCKRGCIGCKKCAKECPVDAIQIEKSLAEIDYEKCTGCAKCVDVCIKKCLVKVEHEG
ncbi:MAG: RnfABCDGE type electron transport complex subunit B [Oscillospiraceae bacterium]|nr:RnfABCDGE type electron transport complex subunit B [Oscillospiraceae bacterium]